MNIKPGDKFVGCWGYDQTQYSIYNTVKVAGKSVYVEGMNGWSSLSDHDLAPGSRVKIYSLTRWEDLTDAERQDLTSRGFDRWSYQKHHQERAIKQAPERTIVKVSRVNGNRYSYLWVLDDGSTFDSTEDWRTKASVCIIHGIKKCLINTRYGEPSIKIDEVIRASHDPDFERNEKSYYAQNEYTAYNGR